MYRSSRTQVLLFLAIVVLPFATIITLANKHLFSGWSMPKITALGKAIGKGEYPHIEQNVIKIGPGLGWQYRRSGGTEYYQSKPAKEGQT